MTRKHYREVAKILAAADLTAKQRYDLAVEFAGMFKRDNANFDRGRFMQAVAVPEYMTVSTSD